MSGNNKWSYKRAEKEGVTSYYIAVGECDRCGKEFRNGNVAASKYCSECAKIIRAEQNRERVRRYREKHKQS